MPFTPTKNEVILHVPGQGWKQFRKPIQVITAWRAAEVAGALSQVEDQVAQYGRWAAGFLAYEAAPAMDSALAIRPPEGKFPLLWFGIYPEPEWVSDSEVTERAGEGAIPTAWQPTVAEDVYHRAIRKIKDHIARGDTYQVNYTYRLRANAADAADAANAAGEQVNPWPLFSTLVSGYPAPYAAFIETQDWAVLSISPELFFTLDGSTLTSKPMKGTAPRGRTLEEDRQLAEWLHHSEKNRAENLMILDMVRNDMGRVARTGSVHVPEIFAVEKYPTVWQMTSTVRAQTDASLPEIMRHLFPAASITGAPKVRTMQIITELESTPRQIYTGAIGFYGPGRQAQFNVAIRTLLLDKQRGTVEYGVGGGIVWDSEPEDEWEETRTKARILREPPKPFDLLETMRWTPHEGWFLLEQHLARLARSAEYFAYPLDQARLLETLHGSVEGFDGKAQMVRLRLARDGQLTVTAQPLGQRPNPARVTLAKTPVNTADRFLYHKTTRRERYQQALTERPGFDDVLLWNEREEVTESTIANVVVDLDGKRVTPAASCGLLPGTFRAWLLEKGAVEEGVVKVEDLGRCSAVYLVNSVRGMWEVSIDLRCDKQQ